MSFSFGQSSSTKASLFKDAHSVVKADETTQENDKPSNKPGMLFTAPSLAFLGNNLAHPWRMVEWTENRRKALMDSISTYKPSCEGVSQARVLLLGPVGAGKSSFISSVHSAFNGRVTNRAMVGSSSASFTKKLQTFNICGNTGEGSTSLDLCDIMGLTEGEISGLSLYDTLAVIKGHAPDGYKFRPDQPVGSETHGYVKKPSMKDKIHCVVFVIDATNMDTYSKGLRATFQQLRENISDLGVHQVALLTHVDQLIKDTSQDITQVYKSWSVQQAMSKAAALLGMPTSYIVPVKNYSSELDIDVNTDILLLSAVDHILQYVDLYFQSNAPAEPKPNPSFVTSSFQMKADNSDPF